MVLPRVLLRKLHRPEDPGQRLGYREGSWSQKGTAPLWGSGVYALAACVIRAFHEHRWCTAFRGLQGGGIVEGLPQDAFRTDTGGYTCRPPIEVSITEQQEKRLVDKGFIPICRISGGSTVAFFGVPSLHLPPRVDDPNVAVNLRLSIQIPYMLAVSRFAHYIKAITRDKVGGFANREEIQKQLSNWLSNYKLAAPSQSRDAQRKRPLSDFRVELREKPGNPGYFQAVTYLRPHYQLEEADVTLRVVVDLADPAREGPARDMGRLGVGDPEEAR